MNCFAQTPTATETPANVTLTAFDARADGAARRIAIDHRGVAITRRYRGIDMRLAVPLSAYRGIVLTILEADAWFELRLAHDDPDLCVTLGRAEGADAMIEEGQSWAFALDLPILVEGSHGDLYPIGLTRPDSASADRRGGHPLSHRRPRFLMRRKSGDRYAMPIVHRDEQEIIARN